MNAISRLRSAESAALEGRHAEALEGFLWFHHLALAEEPALRGVRLSFALRSWLDLARDYPPAMAAFREIRDHNTASLRAGTLDWGLFKDVVAFNEALAEEDLTYRLFCHVAEHSPEFASSCARVAMPALVKSCDYVRARSYIANPEETVRRLAEELAEDVRSSRAAPTPQQQQALLEAHVHIYVDGVSRLAKIVAEAGEPERATELLSLSLDKIDEREVRDAVRQKITGNP